MSGAVVGSGSPSTDRRRSEVDRQALPEDSGFFNLGLGSIMTVELARGLSERFAVGAETERPAGRRVRAPIAIVGMAGRLPGADSVEEPRELVVPALVRFLTETAFTGKATRGD
ncbi:MAG: phosphopantetheine-binding protein [Pseudonocardiaceae bacterium]